MLRFLVLAKVFVILPFLFSNASFATELNVIGNVSVTTQFKTLQKPFWTKKIPEASGGKIKVRTS